MQDLLVLCLQSDRDCINLMWMWCMLGKSSSCAERTLKGRTGVLLFFFSFLFSQIRQRLCLEESERCLTRAFARQRGCGVYQQMMDTVLALWLALIGCFFFSLSPCGFLETGVLEETKWLVSVFWNILATWSKSAPSVRITWVIFSFLWTCFYFKALRWLRYFYLLFLALDLLNWVKQKQSELSLIQELPCNTNNRHIDWTTSTRRLLFSWITTLGIPENPTKNSSERRNGGLWAMNPIEIS